MTLGDFPAPPRGTTGWGSANLVPYLAQVKNEVNAKVAVPGVPSDLSVITVGADGSVSLARLDSVVPGATLYEDPASGELYLPDDSTTNTGGGGTTPPTGGGGGVPPVSGVTYPGQVLNLTPWKITLPLNTAHSGAPDEIVNPELQTFPDPAKTDSLNVQALKYFYLGTDPATSANAVFFMAPVDGYTTSGSSYPRSELREMLADGSANASWTTTDGKTHTLTWTVAWHNLPKSKPQVVGGQIHDGNSDRIEILCDGIAVSGKNTITYRLNGSTQSQHLLENYTLGTYLQMKMVVGSTSGRVQLFCQNMTTPVVTLTGQSWTGCYFKAGCYTQANLTNATTGELGRTSITALAVSHV